MCRLIWACAIRKLNKGFFHVLSIVCFFWKTGEKYPRIIMNTSLTSPLQLSLLDQQFYFLVSLEIFMHGCFQNWAGFSCYTKLQVRYCFPNKRSWYFSYFLIKTYLVSSKNKENVYQDTLLARAMFFAVIPVKTEITVLSTSLGKTLFAFE